MPKKNNSNEKSNKRFVNINIKDKFRKIQSDINRDSRVFFCTLHRINKDEIVEEKLAEATEKARKPKSKKKKIFNICFLILNIALVVLVFYNFAKEQGGIQPLSTLFANHPNWFFLLIAVGLYILTVIFNTLKFAILIKGRTGKFRFWFSLKLASVGRYYDNITPLGSGGQPFEIYYLKKNGYSGDTATAIPLAKYMIWQISFVLLNIVILILYSKNYVSAPLVIILAWVGLSITLLLFLFVFFMSITKKFGASLVVGVLKLLHKMKIIKNYKAVLVKVLRFVKSYQYCIKSFAKKPLTIMLEIFVTMGSIIANALIAYFIYISFVEIPVVSWWDIVCSCCICELAVSFFPMPGGSGAQELSFNALLGSLFPEGTLFWGILIWRFLTYYMYIIQGGFILLLDMFPSKKHPEVATIPNIDKKIKNNNADNIQIKEATLDYSIKSENILTNSNNQSLKDEDKTE
ncbi:MAG: YbhN family protein [Christensenellales bacterium]